MAKLDRRILVSVSITVLIGGCGLNGQDNNVVNVNSRDRRMNAAMVEARSTVGTFVEAMKNPGPGVSSFSVKVPVRSDSGTEHIWVKNVSYDGQQFHGVVSNEPASAKSIKLGDKVSALRGEISDWMYLQGHVLVGGYTIRALRDSLSPGERDAFDKKAPFVIDAAPSTGGRAPSELVGTWEIVSVDAGSGPASRPGFLIEITASSIAMVSPSGAKKEMGEIARTDSTTTPKGIDLSNSGKLGRGIYELSGDEMRFIVADPSQPRPAEFRGQRAGMLFVLKRHR